MMGDLPISLERLQTLLHTFRKMNVGLIGDLFLDRYLQIEPDAKEYSIETGLEAYQVVGVRNQPGALGTVLNNLLALGVGNVLPVSVIGDDGHGDDLLRELARSAVDTSHVLRCADRLTPTYIKPLRPHAAGAVHELNRLDVRSRQPLSRATLVALCERVSDVFGQADGLIVLDQIDRRNEGVVHDQVRVCLKALSQADPDKRIYVDSRRWLSLFDFGTLKGNRDEVLNAVAGETEVRRAAGQLAVRTGREAFCTLGADGILVAHPDGRQEHARGYPTDGPVDIVGAGDSATSGIVLSLLAGASALEAAAVGNLIASITVQQLGTTGTATEQQVLDRWHQTRV
jgi:sugar/nucleoside kinase (ribokinase family)